MFRYRTNQQRLLSNVMSLDFVIQLHCTVIQTSNSLLDLLNTSGDGIFEIQIFSNYCHK